MDDQSGARVAGYALCSIYLTLFVLGPVCCLCVCFFLLICAYIGHLEIESYLLCSASVYDICCFSFVK